MKFKEYKGLDLAKIADEVLARWDEENTFEKSLSTREGHPSFVFFEGPPSANGMPLNDANQGACHGWPGKVAMVRVYDEVFTQEHALARYNELLPTIQKLNAAN